MNGPTILTILRIILIAPLMICIFMDNLPAQIITVICFVAASITDFIDGRWARKTKKVTDLGVFLDPLADKMLVNLTFLALVVLNIVPLWMFAVILIRDFAVDGMRMMSAKSGKVVAASIYGKSKTMVQMITLTLILLNIILNNNILSVINDILLYVVVILTILSGVDYLRKGWKLLIK
ncbi:CDP-diacylglycerol--glycerol-3-phosphate 3-phosphatidyltransferase [Candidatus Saccharibacteria bacterium]|nr:CDP-diacylglycerol--glycerol-3-phosphate 3-phosphatidyltransferase [Candidatus Saccharibacteria bacterium]